MLVKMDGWHVYHRSRSSRSTLGADNVQQNLNWLLNIKNLFLFNFFDYGTLQWAGRIAVSPCSNFTYVIVFCIRLSWTPWPWVHFWLIKGGAAKVFDASKDEREDTLCSLSRARSSDAVGHPWCKKRWRRRGPFDKKTNKSRYKAPLKMARHFWIIKDYLDYTISLRVRNIVGFDTHVNLLLNSNCAVKMGERWVFHDPTNIVAWIRAPCFKYRFLFQTGFWLKLPRTASIGRWCCMVHIRFDVQMCFFLGIFRTYCIHWKKI